MKSKIQKNTYNYQSKRALTRKVYLINLRGGKCEFCGYNKNISALDFHHKNPSEKENQLDSRHLSNTSLKKILEEFKKCIVICSNCHREHHHPELEFNNVVTKLTEYNKNKYLQIAVGKPKCLDCGKEINYTFKRCVLCSNIEKRKVKNRPTKELLLDLIEKNGVTKTAATYGVVSKTIRRWLKSYL